MKIFFDMDGTIANLYAVENWLEMLRSYNPAPYEEAKVMMNMSLLARYLNKLTNNGFEICILSWLSKESTTEYDEEVTAAKISWLEKHLPSVSWTEIYIVKYGVPKNNYCSSSDDILFDDEENNRNNWNGEAYEPNEIIETLKRILRGE